MIKYKNKDKTEEIETMKKSPKQLLDFMKKKI